MQCTKLNISPSCSRICYCKCIFPWWLTICTSDSNFGSHFHSPCMLTNLINYLNNQTINNKQPPFKQNHSVTTQDAVIQPPKHHTKTNCKIMILSQAE